MKFLLILAILLLPFCVSAQKSAVEPPISRVRLQVPFGNYFVLTPGLNQRLATIGYKHYAPNYFGTGLGLAYDAERAFGYTEATLLWGPWLPLSWQAQTAFHFWGIDQDNIAIAPGAGIGVQMLRLNVTRLHTSDGFHTFISTDDNRAKLINTVPFVNFSLVFRFKKAERSGKLLAEAFSNFRIGYQRGLRARAWSARNGELLEAPTDYHHSFYLLFPFEKRKAY